MAAAPLLTLQDIKLTFGSTDLLDGAELFVGEGERLCLVGRNGSGKSTLLKVAAGLIEPDGGRRFAQPGMVIRYLPQEPSLAGFATVRDYVEAGLGESDDPRRAFALLGQLGLSGSEGVAHLSGGEARRAALARALAPNPDILLLDEPTNHLDLPAIEWLEGELLAMNAALVLISHDRRFLTNLSRATVWLDRGRTRRLERGFAQYENWRDEVLEQEEIERHKLNRKIAMEEDWVRYGVSGRRKRNVKRMADLGALRSQRREALRAAGSVNFTATESEGAKSARVIDAKKVSKAFGEREVVKDVSIRILRGDRVGIVGPNGAGKTTLVNLLTGRLKPDGGNVKMGASIEMAALDQNRTPLHPEDTLANVIGGGSDMIDVGGKPRHVVSYMKDFLFTPEQARTPVRVLSGGERARLLLARLLAQPSNLLVLDEPTNDLDLETLDLLEELVDEYPGTAIVVSHDRDFLDRVATSVLFSNGDGHFIEYAGGYSDMQAQRGEGVTARKKAEKPREPKAERERAPSAKKMNFTDKHALQTLPKTIAALEKEIGALQKALSEPDAYARDAKAFNDNSANLTAKQTELSAAEERWLELEVLREELEG
ncbi:MAG TPA: ATP-binding cassette domain-containing protein [Rhizomicrobium sp.]|jgi:ATP-binding cassette subfamily F protein uup